MASELSHSEHSGSRDQLAEKYADRIKAATEKISDERAEVFRALFTLAPWGDGSGGWDLANIKQALAASDDPEIVGAIAVALDDEKRRL